MFKDYSAGTPRARKRIWIALSSFLVLVVLAVAVKDPTCRTELGDDFLEFKGVVTGSNDRPIGQALVMIDGVGKRKTDDDGCFAIYLPRSEHKYSADIKKQGYRTLTVVMPPDKQVDGWFVLEDRKSATQSAVKWGIAHAHKGCFRDDR